MDQDGPTDERRRIEYVRNGPPYVWRWIGSISRSTDRLQQVLTVPRALQQQASVSVAVCSGQWMGPAGTLTGWSPIDQGPSGGTAGRRRPRLDRALRDKKQARTHQTRS